MLETSRPLIVLLFRMSSDVWTNHDMTGEKMEKIKSVALLGAGAVGSYVIYGFQAALIFASASSLRARVRSA